MIGVIAVLLVEKGLGVALSKGNIGFPGIFMVFDRLAFLFDPNR